MGPTIVLDVAQYGNDNAATRYGTQDTQALVRDLNDCAVTANRLLLMNFIHNKLMCPFVCIFCLQLYSTGGSQLCLVSIVICIDNYIYEGRLQSSWTHLITPTRNSLEVRWRSLFRTTSLCKRCTCYNAPPLSRKRAADRWSLRNFLPRSSLFV
jgi:hypothetical protein